MVQARRNLPKGRLILPSLFGSPDGTRIAFQTDRDGNVEIYVMNADGSAETNLTNDPADDFQPYFQPRLSCDPPPANGVAWYRGQGNANDSLGASNGTLDGSVNGATSFAAGIVGQAFSFDGVDDRVTVPDNASLSPTSQWTMKRG